MYISLALLILCQGTLVGQLPSPNKAVTTRAVIVGISEYQDTSIGNLRFAHRDAEAFAAYLQSEVGGGLGEDQLKLLTNERATGARFGEALQWLLDNSSKGDKAIIYFSGHGDVGKIVTTPEYLLLHDASSLSYLTGGALEVSILQKIITTLSVINDVSVIVIADACRSGKLGEGNLPGMFLIDEAQARLKANEIMILSCKADELSREGEQWGGGRGVFSFHLLDALSGMADRDLDDVVTALELRNYLEQKVMSEVAPARQTPLVVMPQHETAIVSLDQVHKDYVLTRQHTGIQQFYKATTKTKKEEDIFMALDTSLFAVYKAFYRALDTKQFFEPTDSCAEYYYKQLIARNEIGLLHGDIRRDYAIALQDDAQILINYIVNTELDHINISHKKRNKYYSQIPILLERALQLLSSNHLIYKELIQRKRLFEGLQKLNLHIKTNSDSINEEVVASLYHAINGEPQSAIAHFYLSKFYLEVVHNADSAIYHTEKALEYIPNWILPLTNLGFNLVRRSNDLVRGREYLERAKFIDGENPHVWYGFGGYYNYSGQFDSMVIAYQNIIKKDSSSALVWANLGAALMTSSTFKESEFALLKALEIDSTMSAVHYYLGCLKHIQEDFKAAELYYLKSLSLRPGRVAVLDSLGHIYLELGQYEKSHTVYKEIESLAPNHLFVQAYLALIAYKLGKPDIAKVHLHAWITENHQHKGQLCEHIYLNALCDDKGIKEILLSN
jgi:tetratricopeptide (TPR) repeat protein